MIVLKQNLPVVEALPIGARRGPRARLGQSSALRKQNEGKTCQKFAQHAGVHSPGRLSAGDSRSAPLRNLVQFRPIRWRNRWWRRTKRGWILLKWVRKTQDVPVGAGPRKGKLSWNPIRDMCFEGFEDLGDIYPPEMIAHSLSLDMANVHADKKVQDCCFQMALLTQCKTEREVVAVSRLEWGPRADADCVEQAKEVNARCGMNITIHKLTPGGIQEIAKVLGTGTEVHVLLVNAGQKNGKWWQHAVPYWHDPTPGAFKKYQGNAKSCEDSLIQEMIELASSSPIVNSVPEESIRGVSVECQTDCDVQWQVDRAALDGAGYEEMYVPKHCVSRAIQVVSSPAVEEYTRFLARHDREAEFYVYIEDPPESVVAHCLPRPMFSCGYRKFMPFVEYQPDHGSAIGNWLEEKIGCPDIALATVTNVRRYGRRCLYHFSSERGPVFIRGQSDCYILPGDVIEDSMGRKWMFKVQTVQIGVAVLTVGQLCISTMPQAGLRGLFGLPMAIVSDVAPWWIYNQFTGSRVLSTDLSLPEKIANNVLWRLEHDRETDPAVAANLAFARNRAAAGEDLPAIDTAARIRAAGRAYRGTLVGVSGSYGWGYCYSCGTSTKGKYEQRLCPSCLRGNNSTLAAAIARGEQVCTGSNPIVYPGIVHRDRQHPPLKAGAKTTETDAFGKPVLGHQVRAFEQNGRRIAYEQVAGRVLQGKGCVLAGIGIDGAGPFVTSAGLQPLIEAIMFRVFKDIRTEAQVTVGAFENATALARSPMLLQQFLDSRPTVMRVVDYILSNPSARRRRQLWDALMAYEDRGEHAKGWEHISAFVKQENLPWFSPKAGVLNSATREYVARLIQAPHDETHLTAGVYLKPLMKALKECWNVENWVFYASVAPTTINQWINRCSGSRSWFWSDYTAFDATFTEGTWKMIEGFYRVIYPDASEDFWKVMEIWRRPKGRMVLRKEGIKVQYDAGVCNCSGRDDTALANALFNGIAMAIAFAAALADKEIPNVRECDLLKASQCVRIAIVGDDSLVGCDFDVEPLKDKVVRGLRAFGLVVKAETSRTIDDVTFLGMMPYETRQGYFMGPTIGRRLYKAFWMQEMKSPASWARGVAQQLMLCRHVPILYEIAEVVDNLLVGKSITRISPDANKPWTMYGDEAPNYDERTIAQICRRYPGLTRTIVESDLLTISRVERLPAVVKLESLEIILQTEEL